MAYGFALLDSPKSIIILFFSFQKFFAFSLFLSSHMYVYLLKKNLSAVVFLGFLEGVKLDVYIQAAVQTQMFLIVLCHFLYVKFLCERTYTVFYFI